ncbi:nuclear pore complex protein Nup50-like [Mytilus californianus]|uniref:nuclear pore complex protein Nup50-like n=1 Tax=Mytilus californianus TaxID=6549 RepID=UPI00224667F3|nr:nuclear pore complex protein Nup50-like [Mytilus californianus]XP_052067391.1 nuclear pore complex protein Nup50-like [Mytilus californianus]
MAKRRADKELTDRNWDEEDEPEEAGEIQLATEESLKGRQILKGKRRGAAPVQNKDFAGFSGFSFKPTAASTPFSFNVRSVTNGGSDKDQKQMEKSKESENGQAKTLTASNGAEKKKGSYLSSLKNLNESVLSWIKSHVDKNPFCILTPVFNDYEKHLEEIMKNKDGEKHLEEIMKNKDGEKTEDKSKGETDTKTAPTFPLGNSLMSPTSLTTESKPSAASFAFGNSNSKTATTTETKPLGTGFQFGSSLTKATGFGSIPTTTAAFGTSSTTTTGFGTSSTATGFSGFNFKSSTESKPSSGFSFAVNKPAGESGASQEEDDEYVPPQAESKEVPEEGSVHSIKCKLFYQKDGAWTERGVGFLHLKIIDEKLQLVVRADTTLGNIILNIILSPSIPLKRQGKNNVSMICVPNPPVDKKADPSKPVPMLIRVKTSEDADQLLEKMEELRKKD